MHVRDERARLLQRHAGSLRIGLEVEGQKRLVGRLHGPQEVLRLMDAVAAGPEMIRAPQQVGVQRLRTPVPEGGIRVGQALRGFVDDAGDAVGITGEREIRIAVVMRQVHHHV